MLSWANALQHRVEYLIVKNALTEPADLSYGEETDRPKISGGLSTRAAIAKAMRESFRQQIATTGIQDTSRFLTDATRDLSF